MGSDGRRYGLEVFDEVGDEGVVGYDIHLRNQSEKSICRQNRLGYCSRRRGGWGSLSSALVGAGMTLDQA